MNAQETYFSYVSGDTLEKSSTQASDLLDKALDEWSQENKKDKEKCPYAEEGREYVEALKAIEENQDEDVQVLARKMEERKKLEMQISQIARAALSKQIADGAGKADGSAGKGGGSDGSDAGGESASGPADSDGPFVAEEAQTKEERAYERSIEYAKKHPILGSISLIANFIKLSWSNLCKKKNITDEDDSVVYNEEDAGATGAAGQSGSGETGTGAVETAVVGSGRVYAAVKDLITKGVEGKHCWDWINKVYKSLGAKAKRVYQNLNYSGKDCGDSHVKSEDLINGSDLSLREGDWLYLNNKNKYDSHGNHSVIFLGWFDKENLIAKTASCPGAGKVGRVERRDLKSQPVTHISRMLV